MSLTVHDRGPDLRQPDRRGHVLLLAGVAVVTAVVLVVTLGGVLVRQWSERADAFTPATGSVRVEGPRAAGSSWTGITTYGPVEAIDPGVQPRAVDVVSIAPRIVENSAGARVRLVLCAPAGGAAPATGSCSDAEPFRGGVIALGVGQVPTLWVIASATRPGTLVVDGYDVTYRDGWRTGVQHVGSTLTLVSTS